MCFSFFGTLPRSPSSRAPPHRAARGCTPSPPALRAAGRRPLRPRPSRRLAPPPRARGASKPRLGLAPPVLGRRHPRELVPLRVPPPPGVRRAGGPPAPACPSPPPSGWAASTPPRRSRRGAARGRAPSSPGPASAPRNRSLPSAPTGSPASWAATSGRGSPGTYVRSYVRT